ncbi:hypothetical protein HK100_000458 [Physocladia obscura]|uniref:Uncharacterized protein n=1 Tax=Physocladia obscura TaxID=109957 RepID=A0AAD5XCI4_9FUNG|nr:hypothetical protein HK100_000458 [Physocladia obscura]
MFPIKKNPLEMHLLATTRIKAKPVKKASWENLELVARAITVALIRKNISSSLREIKAKKFDRNHRHQFDLQMTIPIVLQAKLPEYGAQASFVLFIKPKVFAHDIDTPSERLRAKILDELIVDTALALHNDAAETLKNEIADYASSQNVVRTELKAETELLQKVKGVSLFHLAATISGSSKVYVEQITQTISAKEKQISQLADRQTNLEQQLKELDVADSLTLAKAKALKETRTALIDLLNDAFENGRKEFSDDAVFAQDSLHGQTSKEKFDAKEKNEILRKTFEEAQNELELAIKDLDVIISSQDTVVVPTKSTVATGYGVQRGKLRASFIDAKYTWPVKKAAAHITKAESILPPFPANKPTLSFKNLAAATLCDYEILSQMKEVQNELVKIRNWVVDSLKNLPSSLAVEKKLRVEAGRDLLNYRVGVFEKDLLQADTPLSSSDLIPDLNEFY